MERKSGRVWHAVLVVGWGLAVVIGGGYLLRYQSAPGQIATTVPSWPEESRLVREAERFTLVLFVHPHCPCSRASLAELRWLLGRSRECVGVWVVFVLPPGAAETWHEGPLWYEAQALVGAERVVADRQASETRRFGAVTSGQVLLYNREGELSFVGGITAARGHRGDNAGRRAILAHLKGEAGARRVTPVYGCPVLGDSCAEGEDTRCQE